MAIFKWRNKIFQKNTKKIEEIQKKLTEFDIKFQLFEQQIAKNNALPLESKEKIDELILWKAKVTDMAIGKTPAGKEKMSRFGKRFFGGQSKGFS